MLPKKKNRKLTVWNKNGQKEHVFSLVVVTRESRKEAYELAAYILFENIFNGYEFKLRRGQPK